MFILCKLLMVQEAKLGHFDWVGAVQKGFGLFLL